MVVGGADGLAAISNMGIFFALVAILFLTQLPTISSYLLKNKCFKNLPSMVVVVLLKNNKSRSLN
jgi:hypothetical protein